MIEKSTIVINEKKYTFLKPYACDLIDIEDQCMVNGGFDNTKFKELMLGLVSTKIKLEDLVHYELKEVELSTGEKVILKDIGYSSYQKIIKDNLPLTRTKACKEALRVSGVSGDININNFEYEDICKLAEAFYELYDDSELDRVVDEITTFCLSKEAK